MQSIHDVWVELLALHLIGWHSQFLLAVLQDQVFLFNDDRHQLVLNLEAWRLVLAFLVQVVRTIMLVEALLVVQAVQDHLFRVIELRGVHIFLLDKLLCSLIELYYAACSLCLHGLVMETYNVQCL